MMETILDKARLLGQAVAEHPRTKAFFAAEAELRTDQEARSLMDAVRRHAEHIHNLEEQRKPIEVAEKRKMADLQAKMAANDTIKTFMRAQADYIDLMNRVQRAMEAPISASAPGPAGGKPPETPDQPAAGGATASAGGTAAAPPSTHA